MVKMSTETKARLSMVFGVTKFVFHWGFVPTVLYMGFKKGADPGMPDLQLLQLLWM
ncbi:mitochondrial import receptor subunit TOM7 homolog [Frankliniella occidentalis]|uniref:Mitochondrial import receptor subunit TOM7 homolog n=1 Tax=Frankliniella occidentalis TaxID=133901 RepID=A0A6J1SAL9_FRAOC|nr:mitochondrial import receptor subunit TOM7 homolog [Frankliniella occidentalis]